MIKYIKTNLQFNASQMERELSQLSGKNWASHYNKAHYEGNWSILPLRSINGNIENTVSIHASSSNLIYSDTILLEQCPYLQSVIHSFKCEKTSIRLMRLNAGALIKEHTDHDMNMEAGEARFHIPVRTNKDVAFYIQEDRIPMLAGECWYLNLSLPHRVHNAGDSDRIHLVMDCLVNDWIEALLDDQTLVRKDIEGLPTAKQYNMEEKQKIITELRQLNTPSSLQLADQLERES